MAHHLPVDGSRRLIGIGLGVATTYLIGAELGFRVAFIAEQVTTVWPPTGIALAAVLLWGPGLWPAIWLGAFAANTGTEAPLWSGCVIATGNTLEAVVAGRTLRQLPRFDPALSRIRDVLAFTVIGAVMSTALSATFGVVALCAAGVQPWGHFAALWEAWWLGDALGALVVAPVLMTTVRRTEWAHGTRVEAYLLVGGAVIATHVVFGQVFGSTVAHHPLEYVIFPFVIAAALRGGQQVTALVVLGASAVTIWHTVRGAGPFASADAHQSLMLLQVFMGVLAGTGLLLAAAIAERETGERRRAAAYAAGEVLAAAPDLANAAPAILRAICQNLDWHVGALWVVDDRADRLRCLAVWSGEPVRTAPFAAATKEAVFPPGVGLPGRVWVTGTAAWIENVIHDTNFPRAPFAHDAGLHAAFGFPICVGERVLGVIECFSRKVVSPHSDLLQTMSTLGQQVGQFIGRKREEGAVAAAQRRTSAILETALDAVIGMDHRGTITDFNPAAVRIFGYPTDRVLGRELAELLIPAALREKHREGLTRYLTTGAGPFIDRRVETMGHHADGHEFPVEVSITRVSDAEPPMFTGFVRDLTDRVQAEQERELLLLREATARSEAEAANRAKDEFLATLSHELRTPLTAIVGWTRMLLDGTMDGRSTRRALEVIDRNAHLQVQLVADILDVSRIITGGVRLNVCPVDLNTIIGAALDAVRPAADAKQVQLHSRLAASARITQGDPQRVQQIVWNLLANAVKFTAAGGVVTIELHDGGAGSIHIRVADTGAGIDPEFLPHVFERFRQADSSISRQHGGLGLGLAIVRHLVELHGGTVRADSLGIGKGSTFTVQLPRVDPDVNETCSDERVASRTAQAADSRPTTPLIGYRVLVVDDQEDARDLIATILAAAGAYVETASSVWEALRHLDGARPDVLLSDIGMPGADGYVLIREVRRRDTQSGRHLPAAAITAYAGDHDSERAIAQGFDCHIPKPISRSAIVNAVLSICRERDQPS